jgi:1-phosphofructokinase/tagatose 6-phosphate kinase
MKDGYFLTLCLNPVLQKTIVLHGLEENKVNRSSEYYFDAAGKGVITSRVLIQLNDRVIHLTQAGGRNRDLFLEMLAREGIPVKWADSGSEIRFCYTLLNKAKHTSTEIVEEAVPVTPGTEKEICTLFSSLLPDCHTVIISGTKAAGFSPSLYPDLVKMAKEAGKITVLDYRGDDLKNSLAAHPDVIKPNYTEFISTFLPE